MVNYNWNEPGRVIRVDVMQDKARKAWYIVQGYRNDAQRCRWRHHDHAGKGFDLSDRCDARAQAHERDSIDTLQSLQIATGNGTSVPLAAIANFRYELEQPVIYRRSRIPTITVAAGIIDKTMPDTIARGSRPRDQDPSPTRLPAGYYIQTAGTVEESGKSQGPIAAVVPLMLFVMATVLMVQLQSFQRLFLVVAVAAWIDRRGCGSCCRAASRLVSWQSLACWR